ncbi:MAG: response regulator, partial [Myxococcota bacterium]|nr:response regulator [Myxococcota bacterium]
LRRLGLSADAVANGLEAVQAADGLRYDIIFMDVQMPEMDGLEATRRIRKIEDQQLRTPIPIIALTAHAMHGDEARCKEAGMNDYLLKPVQAPALTKMLLRYLPRERKKRPSRHALPTITSVMQKDPTVFDADALLDRVMGEAELAQSIIATFIDDAPRRINALLRGAQGSDSELTLREAHTLKGAAATVGAMALAELCKDFETLASKGAFETIVRRLDELRVEWGRFRMYLAQSPLQPPERENP